MADRSPALIVCAHGTRDAAGAATVLRIAQQVRETRPSLEVSCAYVDVQSPDVADVAAEHESAGRECVIVPLLLSTGYHLQVDIARAAARRGVRAAPSLGPERSLAEVQVRRLHESGARAGDAVVLAAAGSSRPQSAVDTEAAAELLAQLWDGPVSVGYGSASEPSVSEAVAQQRRAGRRVVISPYLIGRGFFHDLLDGCGADLVAGPLGSASEIGALALARYDAVCADLTATSAPSTVSIGS